MTTTPTEWNTNNLVNPSSTNFQGQQQIVGLSNGNFLVVFADDSGTVGTGVGRDIVGVIYNALGFVVESAFQLNTAGTDSTEGQPSIAATNDGGFMMAYQDVGGGAGDLIRLERYNASGTSIDSVIAQSDPGTALPYTPKIVVDQADNSVFMSYQFSDGNEDTIRGKHFDSNLNVAAGTPADGHIIRTDDDPASNPIGPFSNDTAILTNGVAVTVYHEDDTDQGIEFRRSNASTGANLGSNVNVNSTGNNGAVDYDPKVASLAGGGFVIVWIEDEGGNDNIKAQRYNSTGGTVGAEITVIDSGNNYSQPDVIGLEDGGFFIVARDSTDNRLEGSRYSASGTQVGTNMFAMETANTPQNPELSLHTDGRILVTWNDNLGDIRYEIWDPRDTTINADPGDGQITARVTDDTTLNGTSGAETLFGRNGDDTINPGFGNDSVAGGNGTDTVDYSFSAPSGGIEIAQSWNISLNTGVATRFMLGTAETDTLSSIENVIGSGWGDTITGNNGNNVLEGGNGNDSIFGMNGSDTIEGGLGNDRLGGGFGTDTVRGGVGDDTIFGFDGENIDSVDGGSGSDTVDVSDENGTAVTVDLGGGTWTGIGGTRNISSIETFIGTQVNDDITGGGAAETLIGREGNDTINGGAGDDVLQGDSGNDILNGGSDDDTLDGGDGDDTMSGDGGNDTFLIVNEGDTDSVNGGTGEDTLDLSKSTAGWNVQVGSATSLTSTVNHTGLERIIGSDFGDLVVEGTIDSISTGDGDDVVQTNGSNTSTEIFDGGAGFDRIEFSNNSSGYSINLGTGAFTNSLGAFNFEYAIGGTGDDTMTGSGSADTLIGNDGEDILMGLAGNDSIGGGSGDDTIDGGDDNDNLAGAAGNDSILGGDGDDTVNGGGNDDSIAGGMGNDTLNGNSGNDRIQGGGGNDSMDGGSGHDILDLTGGASAGYIDAMAGTVTYGTLDTIANFEEYILGSGGETFIGRGIAETVTGAAGNDILRGNGGADLLMGGGNDDILEGGQGGDSLVGGGGRDTATYENSSAGVVADLLLVGPQTNDAAGDTFDSIEVLVGSDFNDWLRGRAFAETLSGSEGNDTLSGRGSADLLEGGDGNDVLIGGGGPDVMNGGLGADFIRGDAGIDRIIFTDAVAGVTADLADQTNNTGEATGDTYQSIEDVDGTDFDDSLRGDGETNVLRGRDGNDTLSGRGGDDTLEGGRGADLLSGGNGADQFLYTGSSQGPDTITDFAPGVDTIGVLGSAFGGLTPGSLPAAFFHVGSSAADANDFFVFDATTDRLFYDADGSGGGAQVLLATFTNNPSLNASDIEIV